MGFLEQLGKFAGDMNDKTYGSAIRAGSIAAKGLINLPVRAVEAINPWDAESKGDALLNQAANRYGFTPQFKQQVYKSNPVISNQLNSSGLNHAEASGTNGQGRLHRTVISPRADLSSQEGTLRHEGLHDAYATLQQPQKDKFAQLFNQAITQLPTQYGAPDAQGARTSTDVGLLDYLTSRTLDYKGRPNNVKQFQDLPANLQNEMHSYMPEYFDQYHKPMPTDVANYYANYYNTGGKATGLQQDNPLQQLLGRIFNS